MGITLGGGSNWLIIRSARFPSKPKKATKSAGSSSLGPEVSQSRAKVKGRQRDA